MIAYWIKMSTSSGINYNSEPVFINTDSIEVENGTFRDIMASDETLRGMSILAGDTIEFCREDGAEAEFMFNESTKNGTVTWNSGK